MTFDLSQLLSGRLRVEPNDFGGDIIYLEWNGEEHPIAKIPQHTENARLVDNGKGRVDLYYEVSVNTHPHESSCRGGCLSPRWERVGKTIRFEDFVNPGRMDHSQKV